MSSVVGQRPTASVGVPVYNGERYLEHTLKSLVDQDFADFELIICDNASTDATQDIGRQFALDDPRVRYERNPINIGIARNFNRVFSLSHGKYFRWAMADDLAGPTNLSSCVSVLEAQDDVALALPRWELIDEHDAPDLARPMLPFTWDKALDERLCTLVELVTGPGAIAVLPYVSALMRSDMVWRTGLVGSYPMADQVFLLELALQGRFVEVDPQALQIRIHDASAGSGIGSGDWAAVFRTFYPDRAPSNLVRFRFRRFTEFLRVLGSSGLPRPEQVRLAAAFTRGVVSELV
jgi:glycosyltransferase involved in cell wall biosynthesis